ncbi:MAG: thiamine pyrophosphate-dependent enzyme [Candidatus Bathyarchaeota archaeon]|nr:thiamine pyrophosphate-dependent enzyme [Candidatus Bathyarchaeota archaeon]
MLNVKDLGTIVKNTWCPGCGNFGILSSVKQVIVDLELTREEIVAVTGIGCHGKFTDYVNVNGIHTIHGRVLPVATAIKLSNIDLTVIGFAGDGDAFNIGMGHFPHACRRNVDITYIVHNNQIYGLTTGQTSPTSMQGYKSKTTPRGNQDPPINPLALALTSNATFVARTFVGELKHMNMVLKEAINHRGFALIDVLQPCPSWNRINSYKYYMDRVYKLEESGHDAESFTDACEKAREWDDKIPIGIFYREDRPTYSDGMPTLKKGALVKQPVGDVDLKKLLGEYS